MLRKITFAVVAVAALSTAALAPTSASAWGWGGGWHGGWGHGWGHGWGYRGVGWGYRGVGWGWGYGRGWCYWHPYRCY